MHGMSMAEPPIGPTSHPGDSVKFAVFANVALLVGDVASTVDPDDVQIVGPEKTLDDLSKLLGTKDPLFLEMSPRADVTVPMEYREDAGIPLNAQGFSFIYPSENPGVLEKVQTLKNKARQSWAFVFLIGGYAYYDKFGDLITINAIAFAETPYSLLLVGPYKCSSSATAELDRQGRMRTMTVKEVDAAGYTALAWVHPSERFDLQLLSNAVDYHHGGFVFTRRTTMWVEDGDKEREQIVSQPVLYQLMTKAEYALLDKKPRIVSGPLLSGAVDKLLNQSAAAVAIQDACTSDLYGDSREVAVEVLDADAEAERNLLHFKQALGVCAYFALGAVFYHLNESSPKSCERSADDGESCPWSLVDSLYFLAASISTAGYGDFSPTTTLSRCFTAVYILSGVTVVFTLFGKAMVAGLSQLQEWMLPTSWKTKLNPRVSPWRYYLKELGFTFVFGTGVFLFFAAWVFTWLQPGLSYGDAFWHCFITSTTVGYGDVALINQDSRGFAIFQIVLSVSWLAALIQQTQQAVARRKMEQQRLALVSAQLDPNLILKLERTKDAGVDKVEYVVGMLIALGAELCGEQLNFDVDILPLIKRFETLDADGSGRLEHDDLKFMLNEGSKSLAKKEAAIQEALESQLAITRVARRPSLKERRQSFSDDKKLPRNPGAVAVDIAHANEAHNHLVKPLLFPLKNPNKPLGERTSELTQVLAARKKADAKAASLQVSSSTVAWGRERSRESSWGAPPSEVRRDDGALQQSRATSKGFGGSAQPRSHPDN